MFGAARIGANRYGNSLICNGMSLRLSAHLWELNTEGAIVIARADIDGELNCRKAHLGTDHSGNSLVAPGARVRGAVYLNDGFNAQGAIWLAGMNIGGQFRCDGARLGIDANRNSIIGDGMRTEGERASRCSGGNCLHCCGDSTATRGRDIGIAELPWRQARRRP